MLIAIIKIIGLLLSIVVGMFVTMAISFGALKIVSGGKND